ncbi:uncharacterized protein LOC131317055 [Rhododendron vialii]|uniref:uncharacterized protein LOC131317055 n=1 Tax=Rhododendron vialii TaxID=182163 RepID=UPI00265DFCFE|nr:uncharacterized protein LOC131317055 [Rhododendron vialii]
MGVKVVRATLQWSQPSLPHSPSSPQTLAPTFSSPSLKRSCSSDGALAIRCFQKLDQSPLFGTEIYTSRSCVRPNPRRRTIRRATSAGFDSFSDEEFSKKIQELATRFQVSDDENDSRTTESSVSSTKAYSGIEIAENQRLFEPPDWPGSMEWKANSVELPVSLRMIKRKKQCQEGLRGSGDYSACCSVNKAFSSMVFIIRELHSFTLQMSERLSCVQDLQGVLARVQSEIHASFVWLFQQVFSHTPTLMVYMMILLANYSVYSMSGNVAIAAPVPLTSHAATMESVSVYEDSSHHKQQKFDSSKIKTFSISSSSGKTTSIGANDGGGGKFRPTASNTDGEGRFDDSTLLNYHRTVLPETTTEGESVSGQVTSEEELGVWHSIVEEAARMQGELRDESLDHETMQRFVSPVTAKTEADEYAEYVRTETLYQKGLDEDPNNPLLLANYAQFLYLVVNDYDGAEEYFKRAVKVEPPDAEALSKYASFLWQARKDLWAAEETYLEAIAADSGNSYYAANYAHFLWSTGGEDTCFPLDNNTNKA